MQTNKFYTQQQNFKAIALFLLLSCFSLFSIQKIEAQCALGTNYCRHQVSVSNTSSVPVTVWCDEIACGGGPQNMGTLGPGQRRSFTPAAYNAVFTVSFNNVFVKNFGQLRADGTCYTYNFSYNGEGLSNACSGSASISKSNDLSCAKPIATIQANPSGQRYKWSTGHTAQALNVNTPGTYSVTVTSSTGCSYRASVTVSGNTTASNINASIGKSNDLSCSRPTATIEANPSGQWYKWNTGHTSRGLNVTAPGTYSVTVTNSSGCSDIATVNVSASGASNVNASISKSNDLSCSKPTATIEANPSGQSYRWNTGHTSRGLNVTAPGTYSVTVTNSTGCSGVANVTVSASGASNINASISKSNDLSCAKPTATIEANPSGQSYRWSTGHTSRGLNITAPGTYSVTVTSSTGCSGVANVTVSGTTGSSTLNASITKSNDITCANSSAILTANPSGQRYRWSDGNISRILNTTAPGNYTVTITNSSGCSDVATVSVSGDVTGPTASIVKSNDITCINSSATLTANPSGQSYRWSDGSISRILNATAPGTYSVTVSNSQGCSDEATVTVSGDLSTPNATINKSNDITCAQSSAILTANPSGQNYRWSDGNTSRTRTVSATGTYSVVVTNSSGCSSTATVNVSGDSSAPNASITKNNDLSCTQSSTTLTASPSGQSYRWSDGNTSRTRTVSVAGTYSVVVTNSNGCSSTATINVSGDLSAPNASITRNNDLSCTQPSATLTANPSGQNYVWSDGNTSRTRTVSAAGTYSVVVTNSSGCSSTTTVDVSGDLSAPNASITKSNDLSCTQPSATLTANPSGQSYVWSDGNTSRMRTVYTADTYSVIITSSNGCSSTATINVSGDSDLPSITLSKSNNLSCSHPSATLTANTSGGQVSWSTGQTGNTIQVNTARIYTATVTAANGCTASSEILIKETCTPSAGVGNLVFNDTNNNGRRDAGEAGISGVQVKLLKADGSLVSTTTTNGNGIYAFSSLQAGAYKVMFGTPNGFNTSPRTGFDDSNIDDNNDNNPDNGNMTDIFILSDGEINNTIDAGFTPENSCANKGGDSDGDGVCDEEDNCKYTANPDQADNDGDGQGNVCDSTPNGNGNPCDNAGGDSDGDGVCDEEDNCKYTANPDQADNDEDGQGNVCDDTPNGETGGSTCNDVTTTGGNGQVTIGNIPTNAKVEIAGPSTGWGLQIVCEGNCNSTEIVDDLIEGEYSIKVQTFNPYCYADYKVVVNSEGGNGNPCDNAGGDSDNDGVCDNEDNCKYTANPDQADNDGDGQGNVCDSTPNGNGNLCDNAGGDSDNDGVCDDKDNCRYTANPDQADNDGDGQGNVCDDTPNGETGGSTCNDVTTTGGNGQVTIGNIPTNAKVEIAGPSTGWGLQVVCEGDCNATEIIDNLIEGEYSIKVQTFNPYCYADYKIVVSSGSGNGNGNGNPCDNAGGDSDNDGICDNEDNCKYTANPDQADNDGDGQGNVCDDTPDGETGGNSCDNAGGDTDNDGICDEEDNCKYTANPGQADNDGDGQGNVCDDTPNGETGGSTCNDVTTTGGNGQVTIGNIPTNAKVEIAGPSTGWGLQIVCEGDCNVTEIVDDLIEGEYSIKVQTFNPYCYADYKIVVSSGNGNGNPCDNAGGDSDNDGICDNEDNCKYTANPDQADNDGDGQGNVCDDTPDGETGGNSCENAGGDTDNDGICDEEDNCKYTANPDQADNDGDGQGNVCDDTPDGETGGNSDCDGLSANITNGKLTVSGLNAPIVILKVFDSSWNNVFECNGDKCPETVIFSADPNEVTCHLDVQFYTSGWQLICSKQLTINADAGATGRSAAQLDFAAIRANRAVELQWVTNTGWKNDYFIIEKSTDGQSFETISEVMNTDESDDMIYYENNDLAPENGTNYYRVKQIYKDGSFDYTAIKTVDFNIDLKGISVFPNPADNELFISLKPFAGKEGVLTMTNQFGQITQQIELGEINEDLVKINTTQLLNGLYYLNVNINHQKSFTKKIMIQRLY